MDRQFHEDLKPGKHLFKYMLSFNKLNMKKRQIYTKTNLIKMLHVSPSEAGGLCKILIFVPLMHGGKRAVMLS